MLGISGLIDIQRVCKREIHITYNNIWKIHKNSVLIYRFYHKGFCEFYSQKSTIHRLISDRQHHRN